VHGKNQFGDWLLPSAALWFERFIKTPGLALAPFDYAFAINATNLPGDFHRDPADRFLVSTARARLRHRHTRYQDIRLRRARPCQSHCLLMHGNPRD
jgi:PIN domain nuclease of toxin-antitoxin system